LLEQQKEQYEEESKLIESLVWQLVNAIHVVPKTMPTENPDGESLSVFIKPSQWLKSKTWWFDIEDMVVAATKFTSVENATSTNVC
jgi:hypothetical protein